MLVGPGTTDRLLSLRVAKLFAEPAAEPLQRLFNDPHFGDLVVRAGERDFLVRFIRSTIDVIRPNIFDRPNPDCTLIWIIGFLAQRFKWKRGCAIPRPF